jgi:peptidyl-dipeptidase Dcp
MPQALVDKIGKASTFNQGFATVEYLSSALVDMALHLEPGGVVDPDRFERETLTRIGMPRRS